MDQGLEPCEGKNIEIKARVTDFDRLREAVEALSDTEVEVLDQEDIFFAAPEGRLKLRILGEDSGQLIHYHRADGEGPRPSRYLIAPTDAPGTLRTILGRVLPIEATVLKRRWLYRVGKTRVHLDQVDGLGNFLELEVVLRPGQSESEGTAVAEGLMERLAISPDQLVAEAYIDLLRKAESSGLVDGATR
jgi:predicted adenylyl cyclase CyaB